MIVLDVYDVSKLVAATEDLVARGDAAVAHVIKSVLEGAGVEFYEGEEDNLPQCPEYLGEEGEECLKCGNRIADSQDNTWVHLLPDGSLDPGIDGQPTPVERRAELGWHPVGDVCAVRLPANILKEKGLADERACPVREP